MNSFNPATLVNLLGFAVGVALYALLLVMVVQHQGKNSKIDKLLLATAWLGIVWNAVELFAFVREDFVNNPLSPVLIAVSYSALGFLPSVVVHSAESEKSGSRILTVAAYGLSVFAAVLHFHSAIYDNAAPSNPALQVLTFGSFALIVGLLIFNFRQKIEDKAVLIAALSIFAVSALHLSSRAEESVWLVELVAHQSSLPLVLIILFQDYRFAFADLFLKRALSLLLLTLTAFALYVFAAQPLLAFHREHPVGDAVATGILLGFWIMTALIYPFLHKFSVLLVDKIILKRTNYEKLQNEIAGKIEKTETIETVLNEVRRHLRDALTAQKADWAEINEARIEANLPNVEFSRNEAEIFVATNESPFYKIRLKNFAGGRRLLSEEISLLEAVSLLAARKIDGLRVSGERHAREIREREFTKLAAEAKLTALRSQINPHFLFNALTTIGYLINAAPEKAFETLMKLTKLLRVVLKSSGEFSDLGEELKLIENYLDIEKARFEERLRVEIDVPKDLRNLRVPSLILQPLVENAIKHGVSENINGGTVKISARLENIEAEVFLKLQIYDSGAAEANDFKNSNGIGLENIRQRLDNYYGKKAKLKIESETLQGTTAEIILPVKQGRNPTVMEGAVTNLK